MAEPEDLVQEVFLELSRKYPNVEKLEDLVPLTSRILDNKRRNAVKKRIRWNKLEQQDPLDELLAEDPGADPEEQMISRERRREKLRQLAEATGRLGPRYREVLGLQLQGKALTEIAQLLDEPEGTIYSRSSRGKKALEKELRKLQKQES